MTKSEFTKEQIHNLKAILHKGMSVWLERNKVDTKRVKEFFTFNQNKLGTEIFSNFIINPEKKDEKNNS